MLVQANDKLCKNRNLPPLMQFRDEITLRDRETGEYLWATTPYSQTLIAVSWTDDWIECFTLSDYCNLQDIDTTIERWLVSQALRRDQFRISSGNRAIRQRAVGPRLRPVERLGLGITCV